MLEMKTQKLTKKQVRTSSVDAVSIRKNIRGGGQGRGDAECKHQKGKITNMIAM